MLLVIPDSAELQDNMVNEDVLWVEDLDLERKPLIGIYEDKEGAVSFSSRLSPAKTAKVFAGLLNYILENELG